MTHSVEGSHKECSVIAPLLARVGEKWSMLLIVRLGDGPVRFNELKRRADGISQRMLSHTLKGLERDGLVSRTVMPSVPPRVDYDLTPLGHSLRERVDALGSWALERRHETAAARQRYDDAQNR